MNTFTTDDQRRIQMVQQDTGFAIIRETNLQRGNGWGLYCQRYDHDGDAMGGEFA